MVGGVVMRRLKIVPMRAGWIIILTKFCADWINETPNILILVFVDALFLFDKW